mmetsp:Transcript_39241/g.129896  ORF Transcript_39241/g.129896 Transcript_39241/m.129896 type:complete len:395 (-) Transcript_39241:380-1564(-)
MCPSTCRSRECRGLSPTPAKRDSPTTSAFRGMAMHQLATHTRCSSASRGTASIETSVAPTAPSLRLNSPTTSCSWRRRSSTGSSQRQGGPASARSTSSSGSRRFTGIQASRALSLVSRCPRRGARPRRVSAVMMSSSRLRRRRTRRRRFHRHPSSRRVVARASEPSRGRRLSHRGPRPRPCCHHRSPCRDCRRLRRRPQRRWTLPARRRPSHQRKNLMIGSSLSSSSCACFSSAAAASCWWCVLGAAASAARRRGGRPTTPCARTNSPTRARARAPPSGHSSRSTRSRPRTCRWRRRHRLRCLHRRGCCTPPLPEPVPRPPNGRRRRLKVRLRRETRTALRRTLLRRGAPTSAPQQAPSSPTLDPPPEPVPGGPPPTSTRLRLRPLLALDPQPQ